MNTDKEDEKPEPKPPELDPPFPFRFLRFDPTPHKVDTLEENDVPSSK